MTFFRAIPPEEATGELRQAYERDRNAGQPGSIIRAWSLRPEALQATTALADVVRANLDERRAEFIRVIAAAEVDCSVCSLQHGAMLLRSGFPPEQLGELATDERQVDLDPVEEAIAGFVTKVVQSSHQLEESDVDELRAVGLDDAEIFDIVVWAWFCTYWSGVLNAIGYEPPTKWVSKTRSLLGEGLWEALSVGRRVGTDDAGDT